MPSGLPAGRCGRGKKWRPDARLNWLPEPFAERIETLLANDDLRQRFGEAARQSVAVFQWSGVAQRMSQVYEQLFATHEAGSAARAAAPPPEPHPSQRAIAATDGGR